MIAQEVETLYAKLELVHCVYAAQIKQRPSRNLLQCLVPVKLAPHLCNLPGGDGEVAPQPNGVPLGEGKDFPHADKVSIECRYVMYLVAVCHVGLRVYQVVIREVPVGFERGLRI